MRLRLNLVPSAAILCALLTTGFAHWANDPTASEVEAEEVSPSEFPFVVSIRIGHANKCIGTRISKNMVLTVAKCLDFSTDESDVRVSVACDSYDCPAIFRVAEITLEEVNHGHPEKSPTRYALLRLESNIDNNDTNNVLLHTYYYGHTQDPHDILGYSPNWGDLARVQVGMDSSGESLFMADNKYEQVSKMGSPILFKSANQLRLLGIVSYQGRARLPVYRNLGLDFYNIKQAIENNKE